MLTVSRAPSFREAPRQPRPLVNACPPATAYSIHAVVSRSVQWKSPEDQDDVHTSPCRFSSNAGHY